MKIKTKFNQDLLKGLKRTSSKKVVLLYSAGIDSTAAGLMLKDQGYKIYPLFIDYSQTGLMAEKFLAKKAAPLLGFERLTIIKTDLLKQLTKSRLLGLKAENDDQAWVPGRNTLFMVIAGIFAQQIKADGISLGYMLDDNFVFGDNDYFHHQNLELVLSKSFLRPMKVFLPTAHLYKKDLVSLLSKKSLLDNTVSCWNAKLKGEQVFVCGRCANCLERQKYS